MYRRYLRRTFDPRPASTSTLSSGDCHYGEQIDVGRGAADAVLLRNHKASEATELNRPLQKVVELSRKERHGSTGAAGHRAPLARDKSLGTCAALEFAHRSNFGSIVVCAMTARVRHGFPAERIFSYEAGPLQLLFYQIQLSERMLELYMSGGELLGHGNQEAQAMRIVKCWALGSATRARGAGIYR
jgi:hypothetical protein